MDLAEFLLARIAEDEAAARAVDRPAPWLVQQAPGYGDPERCEVKAANGWGVVREDDGGLERPLADHIARHDPARVLADCEAKRGIVEEHKLVASTTADGIVGCDRCGWHTYSWGPELTEDGPCPTLRLLALPYADHESYREEWKP